MVAAPIGADQVVDKPSSQLVRLLCCATIQRTPIAMPPKPLEELTGVENYLLTTASRLQAAVKWVEQHPPPPDKWAYLNAKVKEEIVSIHICFSLSLNLHGL